eukprot:12628516-Alexandrium_andersonii.AAC.1
MEPEPIISVGVPLVSTRSGSKGCRSFGGALQILKEGFFCLKLSGPRASSTGRTACSRRLRISSWPSVRQ